MRIFNPSWYLRATYRVLFYLVFPWLWIRLKWRARHYPSTEQGRLAEYRGIYPFQLTHCLWIHAVSVGEVRAAFPLIKALLAEYQSCPLLITTTTATGATQVASILGKQVRHVYFPFDLPHLIIRFLKAFSPVIGVIMETELWPTLVACCAQRQIPLCLMNACLSTRSARRYRLILPLIRDILRSFAFIAVRTEEEAERFLALGAIKDKLVVTGNLKFDLTVPEGIEITSDLLRKQLGRHRFIWIAASTHAGEEGLILAAHQLLREHYQADALLILVPRHPERFEAVAKQCETIFVTGRRQHSLIPAQNMAVYLGDTMGELFLLYATADAAFVGGSLVPQGGHNLIEPAALGKPLLSGPFLFNFKQESELFYRQKALCIVNNPIELATALQQLATDKIFCQKRGQHAKQVVVANRGGLAKQLTVIKTVLARVAYTQSISRGD